LHCKWDSISQLQHYSKEGVAYGIFWDIQSILLEFLDHKTTVNADHYCTTLWHLKETIQMKCPGLLTEIVILLHDNTLCHTACVTTQLLEQCCCKCLAHSPHTLDLAPSNVNIFGSLKKHFKGNHF
jgi:hypothetical protein